MIEIRLATKEDLDGIVAVEFERYSTLHREQGNTKKQLRDRFEKRLKNVPEWFWVAVKNDIVQGSISAMPTNKSYEDFESWEKTTNAGTLQGVVNQTGQYVYVVHLDVVKKYTKKGVQYDLMSKLAEKVIRHGKSYVYFESRMPGFRDWVKENFSLGKWGELSSDEQLKLANKYANTKVSKGKNQVLADRLLRFYSNSGFRIIKIIPDAFRDGESLNYGAVCYAENPIPVALRMPVLNTVFAKVVSLMMKKPEIMKQIIG